VQYLLDALVSAWSDHQLKQSMLRDILMYMDKTFCKAHSLPSVYERGMARFRDIVVRDKHIQQRITQIMMDYVRR
jgi:cullin 3